MTVPVSSAPARERALWRAVAIPSEHGGWGLTLEPVLAGLLIAPSRAGVALGVGAFAAFLARTPLKIALVDRRRNRTLPRTRLAARTAAGEVLVAVVAVVAAGLTSGWRWLEPLAVAVPLVGIELWFDVRSRGRRLVPELCGAIGIAAVAPAIVMAGDGDGSLAAGLWMILAGRVMASIPFVRTQIDRLHHGTSPLGTCTAFQAAGALIGLGAVLVDVSLLAGAVAVAALAGAQVVWARRPAPAAKVLGIRQMALGLCVVGATAGGVLLT